MTSTNPPGRNPPAGGHGPGAAGHRGTTHGAGDMRNAEVSHEHSDIDVRNVLMFAAGIAGTAIVCAVIVFGLFRVLAGQAAARDPLPSPVAGPSEQLPPGPHLETNERAMLAKFRAEEEKTLDGYGWVDQGGGVTRIPVAEAKKLLSQRGLPVRASGAAGPSEGTRLPAMGESSSGRIITAKPVKE